jgi:hypothetical protein
VDVEGWGVGASEGVGGRCEEKGGGGGGIWATWLRGVVDDI